MAPPNRVTTVEPESTPNSKREDEEMSKYLNPDGADHRAFREGGASGTDKI